MPAAEVLPLLPDAPQARALPDLSSEAEASVSFALDLGSALHKYGVPAHRLETLLTHVTGRLELQAQFVSFPTAILASFGRPESLRTGVIRVEPGELDLGKLSDLDALAERFIRGECSVPEGRERLRQILGLPQRFPSWLVLICHVIASASAARLFGGHPREILVAALIGCIVGPLSLAAQGVPVRARVLEATAAFLATLLAAAAADRFGSLSVEVTTLAGLIVLLPGLSLTVALTEVTTRNLVSGTARLTAVALVFLQLAFGVGLGAKIAGLAFVRTPMLTEEALPPWTMGLAIVTITLALVVLFQAKVRDTGWVLLATAVAYGGSKFGSRYLGPELGAFLGALLLGSMANLISSRWGRPTLVLTIPGLMLLVPGSRGFRSVQSLLDSDIITGIDTAFSMVLVGVAIVAGLLLANALFPARKVL